MKHHLLYGTNGEAEVHKIENCMRFLELVALTNLMKAMNASHQFTYIVAGRDLPQSLPTGASFLRGRF